VPLFKGWLVHATGANMFGMTPERVGGTRDVSTALYRCDTDNCRKVEPAGEDGVPRCPVHGSLMKPVQADKG
jgi:hypothetical protein